MKIKKPPKIKIRPTTINKIPIIDGKIPVGPQDPAMQELIEKRNAIGEEIRSERIKRGLKLK